MIDIRSIMYLLFCVMVRGIAGVDVGIVGDWRVSEYEAEL